MQQDLSFFPEAASRGAHQVDALTWWLVGMGTFFATLVALLVIVLSIYFRRSKGKMPVPIEGSIPLEVMWTVIPLIVVLFTYTWGAKVFVDVRTQRTEGMRFFVTGKQWMWKLQHPTGHREINRLHVPKGQTILLELTSEDVIHDFFVPAFRVKTDVVPGMYTTLWFEPTKVGNYHLFCAEYCGTKHSAMIGTVTVMEPADYQVWLSGQPAGLRPVEAGALLFENLRCDTCHAAGAGQRGPALEGRFGGAAQLEGGRTVDFDAEYVRSSILEPNAEVAEGFDRLMPSYRGQVTEEQISHLIAYIASLAPANEGETVDADDSPGTGATEGSER
ncbi:MAG: cytochrome c oxidase subunit II [Planctomycetota bacterium]